jgi:hypothetical protein
MMSTEIKRLAKEAVARHYATYDDPVKAEMERRAEPPSQVITAPAVGVFTDVQGSPRESIDLLHLGRVLAERERRRRTAE